MCNEINFRSIIKNNNVEEIAPELFDELVDMFKSTMIESINLINSCDKIPVTKFRLPTREEWESLIKNFSKWNDKKKSLEIMNKDGKVLFIRANGYSDKFGKHNVSFGNYWSSTVLNTDIYRAYGLNFSSSFKGISLYNNFCGLSVRLVSDTPFEGGILFDGIWWKPETEEGYYLYEEAMNKFNK